MQFFKKSNKNKTASAAATPAQTPRGSMDESRQHQSLTPREQKQAKEAEVLYNMISKAVAGGQSGPYLL